MAPAQRRGQRVGLQDKVLHRPEQQAGQPDGQLQRPAAQVQPQLGPGIAQHRRGHQQRRKEGHAGDQVPVEERDLGQRQREAEDADQGRETEADQKGPLHFAVDRGGVEE